MAVDLILSALFGYFLGSIPFGLLLTKMAGHGDVRDIGSGNIGATNVLRTGSKALAAFTLLADMLKGLIPVLVVSWSLGLVPFGIVAGFAALLGHMFPVWLKFKGGKGVATYIGTCFGISFYLGLAFIGIWLAMAFLFKISSLSALVAASLVPFLALWFADPVVSLTLLAMSLLVIIRHRENVGRLLSGSEDRIGQKKSD